MKNGHYSIGEISKLCCIPVSKLRYYDEQGVIKPCFVDNESGYRYYDNETLLLISVLKYYQACGFKLKEIEELLQRMDIDHLESLFTRQIDALEQHIRTLQIQRDSIATWRALIEEERRAMVQPDCPVQHRYYERAAMYVSKPYTWDGMPYESLVANIELCNHLTNNGNSTVGPLYLFFPGGNRRQFCDAKIYIRPHPLETPMTEQEDLGGFNALCTYHKGSFETGEEAYERLYAYAARHDISLRGNSFERSVIDWWSTKKEDEFLLEIILPTAQPSAPETLTHASF